MLAFQYGSNCLESELNGEERLRGDARFFDIARLDGFERTFDVMRRNRGCAASSIVAKLDAHVWGVLYEGINGIRKAIHIPSLGISMSATNTVKPTSNFSRMKFISAKCTP